jgi:hypothetical protein
LAEAEERVKTGQATPSSTVPIKREMLQLKQRLARTRMQTEAIPAPNEFKRSQSSNFFSRPGRVADTSDERERLEMETKDLKDKIALLSGEVQPETVSSEIINDPRFATLKSEYEKTLLNASGDEASTKALANAQGRLARWIQEIYVPELKSSLSIKNARLESNAKRREPVKR